MPEAYLWHLWPGRHWPSSPFEEKTFVEELTSLVDPGDRALPPGELQFERGDVTTVANTLRCGMTLDELFKVAPGVQPRRLLWAYTYVDELRREAAKAFKAVLESPTQDVLSVSGEAAATLMPVPTYRLSTLNREVMDEKTRLSVQRETAATTDAVNLRVAQIEEELERYAAAPAASHPVRLGRLLYDPYGRCLWSHPCFVPDRVGALMPPRIRDLLGERS